LYRNVPGSVPHINRNAAIVSSGLYNKGKPVLFSQTIIDHILANAPDTSEPFYCYFSQRIRKQCEMFTSIPYPNKSIHFATMANVHPDFLSIIKSSGCNVFVNSPQHFQTALDAGFSGDSIIYTASGLSEGNMHLIAEHNAYSFLDSFRQFKLWKSLYPGRAAGLRCNIGDVVTPRETRGGYFIGEDSRLGLTTEELHQLEGEPDITGLHCYAGTDILDIDYFISCYERLLELVSLFPNIDTLNFGGGFGLDDTCRSFFDISEYGTRVTQLMEKINRTTGTSIRLILEPGRIIGGDAGYFVTTVTDVKKRGNSQYIGVNASATQFPRPLMYPDSAFHPVFAVQSSATRSPTPVPSRVCGCSTYSRDYLARDIELPPVTAGDRIIFGHAGSYCASSHLSFLGFPKCRELFL
jgi:diaminopimelate decarboxylase